MSISRISSNNFFQPKQNPDDYARQYAQQKGLSLEDAKTELKSLFGDPSEGAQIPYIEQNSNSSIFGSQTNENDNVQFNPMGGPQSQGLFGPATGNANQPQQVGGPKRMPPRQPMQQGIQDQGLFNPSTGNANQPQQVGGPQNMQPLPPAQPGTQGPSNSNGVYGAEYNEQLGDDPDSYLRQYAVENNLTIEEARAELEAKYGKPQGSNFLA